MTDDDRSGPPPEEHDARVRSAFDSLDAALGERLEGEARGSVAGLRSAAAERDADRLRAGLEEVREKHGWLYKELAKHPEISNLINELALWGF